jgi:hypothetical protein
MIIKGKGAPSGYRRASCRAQGQQKSPAGRPSRVSQRWTAPVQQPKKKGSRGSAPPGGTQRLSAPAAPGPRSCRC